MFNVFFFLNYIRQLSSPQHKKKKGRRELKRPSGLFLQTDRPWSVFPQNSILFIYLFIL